MSPICLQQNHLTKTNRFESLCLATNMAAENQLEFNNSSLHYFIDHYLMKCFKALQEIHFNRIREKFQDGNCKQTASKNGLK